MSLYVDGENKVTTEAMIYKGITYVPVRSVSDAIGKTIKPDFERNSIYIGSEPTQKGITINQAFDLVERKYQVPDGYTYSMNGIEDGKYVIHVFKIVVYPETGDGHTATFGWYYVDKMTKKVSSMF
ncbi:stalk domain-containing protein [Paenibacillus dendritiformis]|uniref:stalk domain-containing protein n=1 Tax=Paenibacillus dendritiformis TaxID=130049 RepID=UPI0031BAD66B